MQTNSMNILVLAAAGLTGLISYAEIRMSRPYKHLKQKNSNDALTYRLEISLKVISVGTILLALCILAFRIIFS